MINATNTLASANFDILKMDGVEDPLININKLATMDFEESYTADATNFIIETRKEITNNKIIFYKSLNESTNNKMILESFSDFFSNFCDIINKFIKFINRIKDKFLATIMNIAKSDSYINNNKKLFNDLTKNDEFEFDGYEYTFNPEVPSSNAVINFDNTLFDELYNNINGKVTLQSVSDAILAIDLEKDYNVFRAKILNREGETISVTEFSNELFKTYRNGYSDTGKIFADISYIRKCLDRFSNYNNVKKEINNQINEIERAYDRVKKEIEGIVKRNDDLSIQKFMNIIPSDDNGKDTITNMRLSTEFMSQIDVYMKAKIEQIQEYSNIHLFAFNAKLDAIKNSFIQDKNVLYTVLKNK